MRLLNAILIFQIFSHNWKYHRSQDAPEFDQTVCVDDEGCNRLQKQSGFQCSVCAEDKSGNGHCLKTFLDKEWFINQCAIAPKCEMPCYFGGLCEHGTERFAQACFCATGYYGQSCKVRSISGEMGLRMVQWGRENAFTKPGVITRFYYRSVLNRDLMEREGVHRMFITGLGHSKDLGEEGKKGMSPPSECLDDKGVLCTEDYIDLTFPFLLPENNQGVTVLKMKDKLIGYLSYIRGKFKEDTRYFSSYYYNVFVNYEHVSVLKCIPMIHLTNCARSYVNASNFSFHRNQLVIINHNVKYLEDGAYLSTAKEDLRCSAEDTIWTWTWSKYYFYHGFETQGDERSKIGTIQKFYPFSLDVGTYRISLRIKRVISAGTNDNFDECFFKVKPLPLEAVIDGGEVRKIIKDAGFTLGATRSYDPNQPENEQKSLNILWTCECLTENIPNCKNTCNFNNQKPLKWMHVYERFSVNPNQLQYNAQYKFKLTVDSTIRYDDKNIAPQYNYVTIKVADESEKVVTNYYIECIQNCIQDSTLPNEILFLKVKVYGNEELGENVHDGTVFEWSYSNENDSVLHSLDSIKLDDLPNSMLAIKEDSLKQGATYSVILTERNSSEKVAQYTFTTASANYEGNCTVEPQSGIKGWSTFDITCDGRDGFVFEFYDKSDEDLAENVYFNATMNYVSLVPDIVPDWIDKRKMLEILLGAIVKVKYSTVADVKLGASTMKRVLQTLNKNKTLKLDLLLVWKTLVAIRKQTKRMSKAIVYRDVSQWIPSQEVKQVAADLLECFKAAIKCQSESTAGMIEENMTLNNLFQLRENAQESEEILDKVKDILTYIHSPGLPPVKLATSDESFQIWAMGHDEDYTVLKMLKKDDTIPFNVSQFLLQTYSDEKELGFDLFFQAALVERNIFSWSKSDVKSKLVSLSMALKKKGKYLEKIDLLSSPILVRIPMEKNLTNTTVKGNVLQMDPHLHPKDLDIGVTVHQIYVPPKGFVKICFRFPPTTESLRVLVMDNFRPDYELMTRAKYTKVINSTNPEYPIRHRSVDVPGMLYMGILPGTSVPVNQTVPYEFEVTLNMCQVWIESQWSTIGCGVSTFTTSTDTFCECTHLSIFSAAFPVPPQSINPFGDAKLFLTVLENPLVVGFVIILFIIYLLLMVWGRCKDNSDKHKGKVIVLADNYPEDYFPYLVAVHTSARFNAGTTAHVGIQLIGEGSKSRAHILSSEKRKVLKKNSDDWFMIYTPKPLGDIYEIQLWHDNYGSSPDWYCEKIVVYDIEKDTEAIFIMEDWLAMREGEYPEAVLLIATNQDMLSIKRAFLDNTILGFRDTHTFFSVFIRHPRSQVTRVQRISILMCFTMVAMLCSIMFYVPTNTNSPTDDFHYDIGTREMLVSIQTVLITAFLTLTVLFSFKNSYKVFSNRRRRTTIHYRRDEYTDTSSPEFRFSQSSRGQDKNLYGGYVRYVSKFLKGSPLEPVSLCEGEKTVKIKKIWYTIAWFSCTVIILGAAYLVMLYGLKLGLVQSKKWLTSLVMAMGEDIFVIGPGKIIFFAILLSMAFQVSTKVDLHGVNVNDVMIARSKTGINSLNTLFKIRSHPMYLPLSSFARQDLLEKMADRRNLWNLVDFINAVCGVILLSVVIFRMWSSYYHGVNHLKEIFSERHQEMFGAVDIKTISSTFRVEDYLEVNLFQVLFNSQWYNNKPMSTISNEPESIRRYWADDGLHKMIGKPRVRQVRVVPDECHNVCFKTMRACLLKWSLRNEDKNVYGHSWVPATYLDTTNVDSPWGFRGSKTVLWWTNQRFYGSHGILYDAGGYYTSLGPTLKEAQMELEVLRESQWQDWYTRACFLTVTLYNVNEKVFSQVTVLFEYFVDGSMSSSIYVIPVSRNTLLGVWELLFVLYSFYFAFRAGHLINRMGLMVYLKSVINVARLMTAFLTFLAIFIWCVHHLTSIKYAEIYMKQMENDYFDFDKFVGVFSILQAVLSLLLCLAMTRIFMLLRGGRRFLNVYYTLIISFTWLLWLALGLLLLIFIFSRLQYFLHCQEFFRIKGYLMPQKNTGLIRTALLERSTVKVFVLLQEVMMHFVHALLIVLFFYYKKIAKAYKIRDSDSFNLVLFIVNQLKKCCSRKKT